MNPGASLLSGSQCRAADEKTAAALGITGHALMCRAARAAFDDLRRRWPAVIRLAVLCGPGNNGGDGLEMARLARAAGLSVRAVLLGSPERLRGEAAQAYAMARSEGVPIECARSGMPAAAWSERFGPACVTIDALLGTGLGRELRDEARAAVDALNRSARSVHAIDVPSGLSADTGAILGAAVRADLTSTFIALKPGLVTGQAREYVGELRYHDLGAGPAVIDQFSPVARLLRDGDPMLLRPPRSRAAHKGRFGHVLVVGGDHGFGGAAVLCARACARGGAGLTSVATRASHVGAMIASAPEVMVAGVVDGEGLASMLAGADVIAVGPGLGAGAWGLDLLARCVTRRTARIMDADALNAIAADPVLRAAVTAVDAPLVLTPHPGEAARLLATDVPGIERDRYSAARSLARELNATVVLKGAGSLIAAPDGQVLVCPGGNPNMASGGMGDVLTGLIAANVAQLGAVSGNDAMVRATARAVHEHAAAADRAGHRLGVGLGAGDVIESLRPPPGVA